LAFTLFHEEDARSSNPQDSFYCWKGALYDFCSSKPALRDKRLAQYFTSVERVEGGEPEISKGLPLLQRTSRTQPALRRDSGYCMTDGKEDLR